MSNIKKKQPVFIYSCFVRFIFFFLAAMSSHAQSMQMSAYGVPVVYDTTMLQALVRKDPEKCMLELKGLIPTIVYDLRYATSDNFTGRRVYPAGTTKAFLRKQAAEALANVQAALVEKKLGLKIFDAYRPYEVTVTFWEMMHDKRYVATPSKGSGHNRGLAVDLTLIDLTSGKELDMGTGFDHFSDTAHHGFSQLPENVRQHRRLLKEHMMNAGFRPSSTEWWHYAWPNNRHYEVLNLWFDNVGSRPSSRKGLK